MLAITHGQPIVAIGKVKSIIDIELINPDLATEFDEVKAIELYPLYFSDKNQNFGYYGGNGKQFHQAQNDYIKMIKHEFDKLIEKKIWNNT